MVIFTAFKGVLVIFSAFREPEREQRVRVAHAVEEVLQQPRAALHLAEPRRLPVAALGQVLRIRSAPDLRSC